ncbi:MAG: hypothetical protein QGI83_00785 [Candidatus Latescibacteria bacterium]|jgi:hypothetical protein|nr:hypothetical protein [Candidatus Latescibacterota bacterium]
MRLDETWYGRASGFTAQCLLLLVPGAMVLVGGICVGLDWLVRARPVWRRGR